MSHRLKYASVAPAALRPLYEAGRYLHSSTTLEPALLDLVHMRASQMNGCAFCLAMHWREAKENGVSDDRLNGLPAWREAPWYSDRERAALAWTEALTDVAHGHVPDEVFAEASAALSEKELVDLTLAISTINAWNRFSIGFRTPPETAADVVASLKKTAQH